MTTAERRVLTDYLDETGARVLEIFRRFSAEQLTFKPEPDRWSIVQNVEHLSIVDRLVLIKIEQVIHTAEGVKESAWAGRDSDFLTQARRRTQRLEAPGIIQPEAGSEPAMTFRKFETSHNCLREFAATTVDELRRFCFPHPVYGELDCYQWLLLSGGAHCERHLAQIRDVIESANFPKGVETHGCAK